MIAASGAGDCAAASLRMWVARAAEGSILHDGLTERVHTGIARCAKQIAWDDAEALSERLGERCMWFGVVRQGERTGGAA